MASKLTTGYVQKLLLEMEGLLGCPIEVVEDRDSRYPAKIEWASAGLGERC